MSRNLRVFVTDCEGPISKNDNAFEYTKHIIPSGDRFFSLISRYDDFLAVVNKSGYKPGETLKYIIPFLKAYGATYKEMKFFSLNTLLLVTGADVSLKFIQKIMPSFIVSTSYEPYIAALSMKVGFQIENTYCTKIDIDAYHLRKEEMKRLIEIKREISSLPMIEIPYGANSIQQLSSNSQFSIQKLNEILWDEIPRMQIGRIFNEVNTIGGYEKARAVKEIVEKFDVSLSDVMYVGDSITDVDPFRVVREAGGLTVSFNGNTYAVREAEIAVLSRNTVVTSIIADVFNKFGKDRVLSLAQDWSLETLMGISRHPLILTLKRLFQKEKPQVEKVTSSNKERLIKESCDLRKSVRGQAIGDLG